MTQTKIYKIRVFPVLSDTLHKIFILNSGLIFGAGVFSSTLYTHKKKKKKKKKIKIFKHLIAIKRWKVSISTKQPILYKTIILCFNFVSIKNRFKSTLETAIKQKGFSKKYKII